MQSGASGPQQPELQAQSNIYTVLVIIATLFTAAAAIYLGYRNLELFGTVLPPPGG
jgi:hypothetical protein